MVKQMNFLNSFYTLIILLIFSNSQIIFSQSISSYDKGLEAYYDNNLEISLMEFQRVIDSDPNHAKAWYWMGMCRLMMG